MIAMTRQGRTATEIAAVIGCHPDSVTRIRRRNGLTTPPPPPLTDAEIETASALIMDGASITEAARTIGRSRHALTHRFPDSTWTPSQVGQHRAMLRKLGGVL